MAENTQSVVRADYVSPDSKHAIEHQLDAPSEAANTDARVAYLNKLRSTAVQLQGQINDFLTQKMDEDKAVASKAGTVIDDKKEEENYGEEVVEEDG